MFARTPRLTLRPGWPEDAPALAAAIGHEAVAAKLARVPWPYRLDDAEAFLAIPAGATDARFLIWNHEAAAPRLIGGIGLTLEDGEHDLDFWLSPDAWGRGYATEAAAAVVDIARHALPVERLTASHHHDNPGSGRVLAKLGFRETGRAARYSLARDAMVESRQWVMDLAGDAALAMAA